MVALASSADLSVSFPPSHSVRGGVAGPWGGQPGLGWNKQSLSYYATLGFQAGTPDSNSLRLSVQSRDPPLLSRVFAAMVRQLEQMQRDRSQKVAVPARLAGDRGLPGAQGALAAPHALPNANAVHGHHGEAYQCVALHVSPDLGERLMLSGERALLDEVFPETNQAVLDTRSGASWNQHDTRHVIRFPLNGYCKLNSVQAIQRLLNAGFSVVASNGGGVEGQQFSEYLFVRRVSPPS
ncbi:hypothetical protein FOCC_FOCC015509 [Frankliniella occidentalis]|nr:hypothetical protein FOCC_FOCC015509 [Frankliniella occidentalis]